MSSYSREELLQINAQCDALEAAFRRWRDHGEQEPRLEVFLGLLPDHLVDEAVRELVPIEMEYRSSNGQTLLMKEYEQRFPSLDRRLLIEWMQESVSDADTSTQDKTALEKLDTTEDADFLITKSENETDPAFIGQYEILRRLGGGGMGTVYEAVHRSMQRKVAVKVMRADLVGRGELIKRFQREVLAAARLAHPNVVTAYDAGEIDGLPYLVTELVEGIDLKRCVKQHGPMSWKDAMRCVRDAAEGLQYAHSNAVVHRDIKPANLLMDAGGQVKVLDLGLARLMEATEPDQSGQADDTAQLTTTGVVMGTAAYMAPEQARQTRAADARSDVYSLGCVLYFLIVGRPPYRGESVVDTILAHVTSPIPKIDSEQEIPEGAKRLVGEMMQKDPESRPQTMGEVIQRISALLRDQEQPAVTPSAPSIEISPRHSRSNSTVKKNAAEEKRKGPTFRRWLGYLALVAVVTTLGYSAVQFAVDGSGSTDAESIVLDTGNATGPRPNNAVVFDGDGYIHVPSVDFGPGDQVTLEMIVRLDDRRTANPLCWLGESWMTLFHNGSWGVCRLEQGESLFQVSSDGANDVRASWQHVAGTWDGDSLRLYINGNLVPQAPIDFDLSPTNPGLYIGGVDPRELPDGQNSRFLVGAIDAVRVTQRVIYPDGQSFLPPDRLHRVPDTLVLFQFDEKIEAEGFQDSSGNGHDGVGINVSRQPVR